MDAKFNQKRVNHIFHYTESLERLLSILSNGFAPSYCEEKLTDLTYLIPMVSFCNISIRDVDLYMRYGNYGIGLTIDWAIKNRISPVIYIHENSPFNSLHRQINEVLLGDFFSKQFADFQQQIHESLEKSEGYSYSPGDTTNQTKLLTEINKLTVPALQFFKNWITLYHGNEIITYQEREWRYVPELESGSKIIPSSDPQFAKFIDKTQKPKPHLPNYTLQFDISDIRYIIIKNETERIKVIKWLSKIFKPEYVTGAIIEGKLFILTDQQVRNDF